MSRSPSGVPAGDTGRFMSPNGSPPGCTPRVFRPRSLIAILEPRRRTRWRTPRPALEPIQADSGSISIMIGLVIVTHGRLAEEFVTAMEHVVGKQERIGTICIRSEEHTSELQSLMRISYAVFCLK